MIYGFIGTGNMGGALVRALCKTVDSGNVLLANRTPAKARALAEEFGCRVTDNETVAREAEVVFLGVKPHLMAGMLAGVVPILAARQEKPLLVSMAAGLSLATLREMIGVPCPVLRIMPNTPVAVGEGMTLYSHGDDIPAEVLEGFFRDMARGGRYVRLEDPLIDAGSAVSGCGPAFADLFVEALADGGVFCGLPRAQAQELAAQMLLGAAKLILESGKHPGKLKDEVCSPGGSTIRGVHALELGGFRAAVMNAVVAACERTKELG